MRQILLTVLLLLPLTLYAQSRPTAGRIMGGSADPTGLPCNSSTTITDFYIRSGVAVGSSVFICRAGVYVIFAGGSGTPGGADTQVQFNDSSAFGGVSGFTFNKTAVTWSLGGATKRFTMGNGGWATYAVPYFRAVDTNRGMALDLMPNGTLPGGEDVHQDICSTDITADSTNFECLELKKTLTGAHIGTKKAGTGTVRDLTINENGANITIGNSTTGRVGIGAVPADATAKLDILTDVDMTAIRLRNSVSTGTAAFTAQGTGRSFAIGVGNASHADRADKFFIRDATGTTNRLVLDGAGLFTFTGSAAFSSTVTATAFNTSATGAGTVGLCEPTGTGSDCVTLAAPASVTASYTMKMPAAAAAGVLRFDGTDAITFVAPSEKVWLAAAGCVNTTAASFWDLPTSTPAVAACVTGTNTQKGVLQYADTSGGFSAQNGFLLPTDFTGTVDANIIWKTTATSGNAKFSLSTICTAVAATETDDPAFNTASTVVTAAPGTANRLQTSPITTVTITGCAAGELLHLRLFRDGNDGSDTLSASLDVIGVEISYRRNIQ